MKTLMITTRAILVMTLVCAISPAFAELRAKPLKYWDDYEESSQLRPDHSRWQALLDKFVLAEHPSGIHRFKYSEFGQDDERELRAYLTYLQQLDPRQLNKSRQKAYWLNLYNATIVLIVVVSKPSESIRSVDRGDFWALDRFDIAGQKLSLDNIEHGILRALFKDKRVHFALNRAALGSASINPVAYTGDNVDGLMEQATREFLQHPRAVNLNNNRLVLSRLFIWYKSDFGSNTDEIKEYLKQYSSPEMVQKIDSSKRISYQYDWSLNKP